MADLVPLVLLGYSDNPANPTRFKNNSRRRFRRTFYLRLVIPDARNICAHVFVAYTRTLLTRMAMMLRPTDRRGRTAAGQAWRGGRLGWLAFIGIARRSGSNRPKYPKITITSTLGANPWVRPVCRKSGFKGTERQRACVEPCFQSPRNTFRLCQQMRQMVMPRTRRCSLASCTIHGVTVPRMPQTCKLKHRYDSNI